MEYVKLPQRPCWVAVAWDAGTSGPHCLFIFGDGNPAGPSTLWHYSDMPEELAAICQAIDDAVAEKRPPPWRQAMDWMLQHLDELCPTLRETIESCVEEEVRRDLRS